MQRRQKSSEDATALELRHCRKERMYGATSTSLRSIRSVKFTVAMKRRRVVVAVIGVGLFLLFAFLVPIPIPAFYVIRPGLLLECPRYGSQPGCPVYGSIIHKFTPYGAEFQYPNWYLIRWLHGPIFEAAV
jgi:hypothetical protein